MKLIITKTFSKKISKLKSVSLKSIEDLIFKLPETNLIVEIDNFNDSAILKWYLNSKRVRMIVLFEKLDNIYIPVSLFKKESKNWYNITKNNYFDLCSTDLNKWILDYKNGLFEEIELKKVS